MKNYYIILGVSNTAGYEEIKAAYRVLAKKYHPDKNMGNKNSEEYFKEIQEAYNVLSNPEKRKKYDLRFSYGSSQQTRQKAYGQYTGNAYQYAQQQAQYKQQGNGQTGTRAKAGKKPDRSENYYILISVGIAMVLLYFIISYSTGSGPGIVPATTGTMKKDSEKLNESPEPEETIHDFDSPYSVFFGEEIADIESKNYINIANQSGSEAIVCLVENKALKRTIRNQYMRAGAEFKMNNIPDGDYYLKIYYGSKWDPEKKFGNLKVKGGFHNDDPGFRALKREKDIFKMKQETEGQKVSYSSYDIVLNPFRDTVGTKITEGEFFR